MITLRKVKVKFTEEQLALTTQAIMETLETDYVKDVKYLLDIYRFESMLSVANRMSKHLYDQFNVNSSKQKVYKFTVPQLLTILYCLKPKNSDIRISELYMTIEKKLPNFKN